MRKRLKYLIHVGAMLLSVTSAQAKICHHFIHHRFRVNTRHQPSQSRPKQILLVGMASWYGPHVHRRTANHEIFDPRKMTCAHRTLPMGTVIKVTNESTGKAVVVRVNDRGPYNHRIIDLTQSAARAIGVTGVSKVHLNIVSEPVELAEAPEKIRGRNGRSRR